VTEEKKKTGRSWMKIVLILSLALNFLVVGALVGSRFGAKSDRGADFRGQIAFAVGPYGRALSKEDRRVLGQALRARSSEFRKSRQEMRTLGAQVATALREEPFEPAKVASLLEQQIGLGRGLQNTGQALLVERLVAMSAEERAAYADRLEKVLKRGPSQRVKR